MSLCPSPVCSRRGGQRWTLVLALAILAVAGLAERAAADRPTLVRPWPGGFCPFPILYSTSTTSNQAVTMKWTGFAAPYHVQRVGHLGDTNWTEVGSTTGLSLTVPEAGPLGFFRIQGPSPDYAGAARCLQCHVGHATWSDTAHAHAFDDLEAAGMGDNPSCVACHSVGFGAPTGFIDVTNTPGLAGVQCENCHGPAADHANNPDDLLVLPVQTESAMLCGGCHTGPHNPQYDEWVASPHAAVVPHVASAFLDPARGPAEMQTCGACHSGATRLALVEGAEYDVPPFMPTATEATNIAVTCAVCHDPHVKSPNTSQPYQLRNPVASMKPFSYDTSRSFADQYDPTINLCGQCHNMRGAEWTDTSRPPHHSPQYNILIGAGGVEHSTGTPPQSYHRNLESQCAQCHVASTDVAHPTATNPNLRGHTFRPNYNACAVCHVDAKTAMALTAFTQADVKQQIGDVKQLLDQWATTRAPAALQEKYGALAWEYTTPGELSDPTGTLKGPTTAEQAGIPDDIKQARFNLYLVQHDGSFGVHNGKYTLYLLQVAAEKVTAELGP
jgi:Cytochrome c554 and c-prime